MGPSATARAAQATPFRFRLARDVLRAGGVIAYPTEGVFGIGCDPANVPALQRVIELKGRAPHKGLILIGASEAQLMRYAKPLDGARMRRIRRTWPGPVTWVLPVRDGVDALITGGRSTVAVRVTAHPVAAGLCAAFGAALVSTSANLSGRPPARHPLSARRLLGGKVDLLVSGRVGGASGPSTIRDGQSGRTLRGGRR